MVARSPEGFRVIFRHRNSGEEIYSTMDGSDPRLPGGEVSTTAMLTEAGETVPALPGDSEVRIHVPTDGGSGLDWTALDFDDSGWTSGQAPVGFETSSGYEELIRTDVRELMYDVTSSIYLRFSFDVESASSLAFLTLRMRYDDGFVAYLNGELVGSVNAPPEPTWNTRATRSRPDRSAIEFEDHDLTAFAHLLKRGAQRSGGTRFELSSRRRRLSPAARTCGYEHGDWRGRDRR